MLGGRTKAACCFKKLVFSLISRELHIQYTLWKCLTNGNSDVIIAKTLQYFELSSTLIH